MPYSSSSSTSATTTTAAAATSASAAAFVGRRPHKRLLPPPSSPRGSGLRRNSFFRSPFFSLPSSNKVLRLHTRSVCCFLLLHLLSLPVPPQSLPWPSMLTRTLGCCSYTHHTHTRAEAAAAALTLLAKTAATEERRRGLPHRSGLHAHQAWRDLQKIYSRCSGTHTYLLLLRTMPTGKAKQSKLLPYPRGEA